MCKQMQMRPSYARMNHLNGRDLKLKYSISKLKLNLDMKRPLNSLIWFGNQYFCNYFVLKWLQKWQNPFIVYLYKLIDNRRIISLKSFNHVMVIV